MIEGDDDADQLENRLEDKFDAQVKQAARPKQHSAGAREQRSSAGPNQNTYEGHGRPLTKHVQQRQRVGTAPGGGGKRGQTKPDPQMNYTQNKFYPADQ